MKAQMGTLAISFYGVLGRDLEKWEKFYSRLSGQPGNLPVGLAKLISTTLPAPPLASLRRLPIEEQSSIVSPNSATNPPL